MKKSILFIAVLLLFAEYLHPQSWTKVQLTPVPLECAVFFNDTGIIISDNSYIIKSNDYFNTFVIDSAYDTAGLWGLSFPTRSTGYINMVGNASIGTLKTNDWGNTWEQLANIITPLGIDDPDVLLFVSPDTGYSGSSSGSALFATYNGGITWQVNDANSANPLWGDILRVKVIHDSIIYMLIIAYQTPGSPLNNTCIERSLDYGRTWTQISSIFSYPHGYGDFYFLDDTTFILSLTGEILKSINGGLSFDTVMLVNDYYLTPTQAIAFSGHDTGFVAFANSVYKTYDAGNTWTSANFSFASDEPQNKIYFLTMSCSQNAVVGCAYGDIYKTENGCGVSGIGDVPHDNSFSVYPDPTSSSLVIKDNFTVSIQNIEIYNTMGEQVFQTNSLANNEINVSHLAPGVYFLIVQGKEQSQSTSFVKF